MASSSKLLALILSSSLLRSCRLASTPHLSNPSCRLPGPPISHRFCSAAAASESVDGSAAAASKSIDVVDAAVATVSAGHPWPEWGEFIETLRAKGFFDPTLPVSGASAGEGARGGETAAAEVAVTPADTYHTKDLNRVKNACLKFARERFDLLSSLPKQDIQAIVECGCPNINRKNVNSAKRLREFVQVEEKVACSACKLRGSCDKAYVIPKAEEGTRTVDVVRILLAYAIESTGPSGENSVDGGVQESARKLLSKLIVLSDTTIDPSLPIPVFQTSSKKETKSKESVGKGRETAGTEMKKGDWLCPNCNFLNFARNRTCLECKASGPKKIEAATTEMKMGDWICPQCHFMNFSRNKICFKCEEHRPKRQLNPGEWECPSCDFVNFRRNKVCKKCNHDHPEDGTQDNHRGQRNMKGAGKSRHFDYIDEEENDDSYVPRRREGREPVVSMKTRLDRKTASKRSVDVVNEEDDGLLTAKSRRAGEDDNDVLP